MTEYFREVAELRETVSRFQSCTGCRTPEAAEKLIADERKELLRVRRDAADAWSRLVELQRIMKGRD